jgi:hypothetical protein
MGQLTVEERRRIFLNRQHAGREALRRLSAPVSAPPASERRSRRLVEIALTAALLVAGWFVSHGVAFHGPASLAEMLLRV